MCEARKIKKIKVYSPTKANRERFAKETSAQVGVEIMPVDSYEAAAKDVDILITSTNARKPFLGKSVLREGLHISAMQRDEFDDEALMACQPLVLHTHSTENNVTSSALAHFERDDFTLRDHPTVAVHRLAVSADLAGSPLRPDQGTRKRPANHRLRQ